MPTDCTPDLFGFAPVEGREVVAAFDGGNITSDAGGLLLGATDRAIRHPQPATCAPSALVPPETAAQLFFSINIPIGYTHFRERPNVETALRSQAASADHKIRPM